MRSRRVRSSAVAAVGSALLVVWATTSMASAGAPSNRPTVVAIDAHVEGATVEVRYTVNRSAKQIVDQECALNAVATSCDPDGADSSTTRPVTTSYSVSPSSPLAPGVYAFRVAFLLSDGGTGAAVVNFTIPESGVPCLRGETDGRADLDFRMTGAIDTPDNGSFYGSTDGTCRGDPLPVTIVQSVNHEGAVTKCAEVVPKPWDLVLAYQLALTHQGAPEDHWWCDRYFLG